MSGFELRRFGPHQLELLQRESVDADTLAAAAEIVDEVRRGGESVLRRYAERFGELEPGRALIADRTELEAALHALPVDQRGVLERAAARIESFARVQLGAVAEVQVEVPGGTAGHTVTPVRRAGCYAPGGRYPLPSSVLMTALTARVAGVDEVWVASPRPAPVTLAAAALAGADAVLTLGGAHAIAAMAWGVGPVPECEVVVGPGNRWVTAAKKVVAGRVGIDMLAGPSELVVLADDSADPELVAADLLAQAEHDPDALPVLVTTSAELVDRVQAELSAQLVALPSRVVAEAALANGGAVICSDLDAAVNSCDRLAPEHLQVLTRDAEEDSRRVRIFGALFVGPGSAEVLGDYGAGPNHTLPTGGSARFSGGLSVLDFLAVRSWLRIDRPEESANLAEDAASLARLEGLEAHARAAEMRTRPL